MARAYKVVVLVVVGKKVSVKKAEHKCHFIAYYPSPLCAATILFPCCLHLKFDHHHHDQHHSHCGHCDIMI